MAMTVYLDPVDVPPRGDFDVNNGWSPERVAKITGVAYNGPDSQYTALVELVDAGELPSIGAAHPTINGATLTGYSVEMIEPGKMVVRMRYRQPISVFGTEVPGTETPVIRFSATLAQEQSNFDVNGQIIVVQYEDKEQSGIVTKLVPQMTIEVSRLEIGDPTDRISGLIGTLNQEGWRLRPMDSKRTWLFVGANASTSDFGVTYRVDYQFEYRRPYLDVGAGGELISGWDPEVVYIDPNTGRPPKDAIKDPAVKRIQLYRTGDFNTLNLA